MIRRKLLLAIACAVLAARCATVPPPVAPQGDDRYLVDPRTGFAANEKLDRRLDTPWRAFLSGDLENARKGFEELRQKNPAYLPASLGEAAIDIKQTNYDHAAQIVAAMIQHQPDYTAARVYEAEIAARQHQLRRANDLYSAITSQPGAPEVSVARLTQIRQELFDELVAAAVKAPADESARILREALAIDPSSRAARMLLVSQLITAKNWEQARRELAPLTNSGDVDRTDVQAALAEIEVGQGEYEQAIVRYDRLARREKDPKYLKRLEEVKQEWNLANLPPQYREALASEALTRDQFAVLLYWKVASVRFAQNLGVPPIAVDISDVAGRDELVRAIAIGVLGVDPVTRRVSPNSEITAAQFARLAARVLVVRGAPCVQLAPPGPEPARSQSILAACAVTDPSINTPPDAPVSGRVAAAAFDQIDRALSK